MVEITARLFTVMAGIKAIAPHGGGLFRLMQSRSRRIGRSGGHNHTRRALFLARREAESRLLPFTVFHLATGERVLHLTAGDRLRS